MLLLAALSTLFAGVAPKATLFASAVTLQVVLHWTVGLTSFLLQSCIELLFLRSCQQQRCGESLVRRDRLPQRWEVIVAHRSAPFASDRLVRLHNRLQHSLLRELILHRKC